MSQFHETRQGRIFFENQIPALIKAIEDLNKTIKEAYNDYTQKSSTEATRERACQSTPKTTGSKEDN